MKISVHVEGANTTSLISQLEEVIAALKGEPDSTPALTGLTKTAKRGRPAKTVSPDEDENFGKKPLKAKDLGDMESGEEEDEESEEDTDDEMEDEDADEDDSESSVSWIQLKAAIDKYGERKPNAMSAIIKAHGLASTKELKLAPMKWESVYRKTLAAIKALKKVKA